VNKPEAQRGREALPSSWPLLSIAARTLPAVVAAGLVALGGAALVGGGGFHSAPWAWSQRTDRVDDTERQARRQAFEAIGSLRLAAVPAADTDKAIADMPLSAPERQALAADLARAAWSEAAQAPTPTTNSVPQAAAEPAPRLRLVWVTLWDTDVEDGDVVRIACEGYSRTVVLTKHGTTLAVPLPANGVIRITGINDGDGGGITVGLASGDAKVLFPIMSVGQTLQLAAVAR
jgi:hypothetical protein